MLMANPATDVGPMAAALECGSRAEQLLLAAGVEIEAFPELGKSLTADACAGLSPAPGAVSWNP